MTRTKKIAIVTVVVVILAGGGLAYYGYTKGWFAKKTEDQK